MTIAQFSRHSVHRVRQQLEQALHALPKDPKSTELSLIIEEAIEISYEVELTRHKGVTTDPVVVRLSDRAPALRP